jgi:hypothetical protein
MRSSRGYKIIFEKDIKLFLKNKKKIVICDKLPSILIIY